MKLYDVMQWLVVAGVVLVSVLYMLGQIAPQWRIQFAQHFRQPRYANWINRLGTRLSGNSGCGSCDSCGSCSTSKTSDKK